MGRKYKIRDQQAIYFVTFTVVEWIDLFIRDDYKQVLIDSLRYCQKNKGLSVYAYCIMTSHVHLIISSSEKPLSDIIRDLKSYTSKNIYTVIQDAEWESRRKWLLNQFEYRGRINSRNKNFQIWQQNNHPIDLSTNEMLDQRLEYIHNNPLVAGFVDDPCAWVWSSCRSYEDGVEGMLDLDFID